MSLEKEVIQGHDAKQLLENPVFAKAMNEVQTGLMTAMKQSALGDESTHHRLVIALQLLDQIKSKITEYIETGRMSEMQLDESRLSKLKKAFK
jgi:hypothetical protein